MNGRKKLAAAIVCGIFLLGNGPKLVTECSPDQISIRGDFNGAQLLCFGAITYPKGVQTKDKADVVIVLKGPSQSIVVREKQQVAGIWINAASSEFRSAPGYYAVASTRPVEQIVDPKTADIYELGLNHLQLSPAGTIDSAELNRFTNGLVELNRKGSLYKYLPNSVKVDGSVLYQARIDLPASVPVGQYTAETFLVINGRIEAAEVKEITIAKSGMGRFINNLAQKYGFFYGLIAVSISVFFGWTAGYVFRKI